WSTGLGLLIMYLNQLFLFSLLKRFSLTPPNHSSFKMLKTILSLLFPSSRVGIFLRRIPSTSHPSDFIAAMLRSLLLSALNSNRSNPIFSKAKVNNRYLECLFNPVPWNLVPYQV